MLGHCPKRLGFYLFHPTIQKDWPQEKWSSIHRTRVVERTVALSDCVEAMKGRHLHVPERATFVFSCLQRNPVSPLSSTWISRDLGLVRTQKLYCLAWCYGLVAAHGPRMIDDRLRRV